MIKHLFFDLDGTLVDSADSISWSFIEAAKPFSDRVVTQDQVIPLLGGFRLRVFEDLYGLAGEDLLAAKAHYGTVINGDGYLKEKLYPGIRELLLELFILPELELSICSARRAAGSIQSLRYAGIETLFTHVIGPDERGQENKAQVLREHMEAYGMDPLETLMVGDMVGDIHAAKENRVSSIALSYGFGTLQDMEATGADYLAHSVSELREILLPLLREGRE